MKRFSITVIENETGKVLVKEESDCIIGTISLGQPEGKDGYKVADIKFTHCMGKEIIHVLESLDALLRATRKELLEDFIKENPDSLEARMIGDLEKMMEDFGKLAKQRAEQKNEPEAEKEETVAADTESRSPYAETVDGMLSGDYKERFKAEYQQTKIRYEKLKAFCNRIEAARHTMGSNSNKIEEPKHDCPFDLLRGQQRAMGEYLHYLEIRAVIEGIEL